MQSAMQRCCYPLGPSRALPSRREPPCARCGVVLRDWFVCVCVLRVWVCDATPSIVLRPPPVCARVCLCVCCLVYQRDLGFTKCCCRLTVCARLTPLYI